MELSRVLGSEIARLMGDVWARADNILSLASLANL